MAPSRAATSERAPAKGARPGRKPMVIRPRLAFDHVIAGPLGKPAPAIPRDGLAVAAA